MLVSNGTLKVIAASTPPIITNITLSGTNLVITGIGGTAGGSYSVLSSTNLGLPVSFWASLATNLFSGTGTFSFTNTIDPASVQRFYLLKAP